MQELIEQAKKENKWLYYKPAKLWYEPLDLQERYSEIKSFDEFSEDPTLWAIRDPHERIKEIDILIEGYKAERNVFVMRMLKSGLTNKAEFFTDRGTSKV